MAAEKKVKKPGIYQNLVTRRIECKFSVRENIITVMLIITAILAMIDINI